MRILRNTISGLLAAAGMCCLCVDIDCMAASPVETMAVLILGAALFGAVTVKL